jgi:hypothetical protein
MTVFSVAIALSSVTGLWSYAGGIFVCGPSITLTLYLIKGITGNEFGYTKPLVYASIFWSVLWVFFIPALVTCFAVYFVKESLEAR